MTHPNTLPSTHEVQSAIHRVRGTRVALAEAPRTLPEILPPEGASAPLLPNGEQLRDLAENILDSGQQSLVDYIANPTTKRKQAVAAIMKTLAETAGEDVRT